MDVMSNLRYGVRCDFMTVSVQVLYLTVVCPFVGYVESGRYGAAIGIYPALLKKVAVKALV